MRVVLTNDTFIPIQDGVGRVVYEYANTLGRRGHECYVVAPMSDAGYRAQYPFEIVDFQSIILPGSSHYRTGVATLDGHYMSRIGTVQPELIHAHSPGPAGMEAVRLASKYKVPLIGTFHSKFYDDFLKVTHSEGLANIGVKYVVNFFDRCDEVWTVSNIAADTLREYGYNGRIEIVQNGVNTHLPDLSRAHAAAMAQKAYKLDARPVLLYVGQINWKKNLRCILDAATLLQGQGLDFQLAFVGTGPETDEIRAYAQERLTADKFVFTGHVTDATMLYCLYCAASLFVFPSEYDTAGLVVREAAIAGTPSVVLRGSAPAEVIRAGENGLLCDNSPESLATSIADALRNPEQLVALGAAAKRSIPLPWETVIDEVESRYTSVLEREKPALKRKRGLFRKELNAIDNTLEKRTVDLLWRFLKQDMQHIYTYEYAPRQTTHSMRGALPLPRSAPEAQGVRSEALLELYRSVDRDSDAHVHSMLVARNGHVLAEAAWAPYDMALQHQLFSMSKSITGTAIGMLVDEGKLLLTERLIDLFSDKVEDPINHPMRACTVWHLLTMSTGARFNEVGTAFGTDWEREFLDGGVRFAAGTQFEYNSLNTYMLAAIVRRITGGTLLEYLRPRLFEPLKIAGATWETCPMGTEKGGWGLSLTVEDAAKIGLLYLQKGKYMVDGTERRLISEEWIAEATRPQIDTPFGECKDGYGYQIWMAPHNEGYIFNGAFGQYLILLPAYNALVAVLSGCARLFADGDLMEYVLDAFSAATLGPAPKKGLPREILPFPENPRMERVLRSACSMFSTVPRLQPIPGELFRMPFTELARQLDGMAYTFPENVAGLLPVVQQSIHNNYSSGIERVRFAMQKDGTLAVEFFECGASNTVPVCAGDFLRSEVRVREESHSIATYAMYGIQNAGDMQLRLFVYFLETPCVRILTFTFQEDGVILHCDEQPSIQDSVQMLMELAGMTQMELLRGVMPLLKRDSLKTRLRSFTTTTIQGVAEV